MNKKTIYIILVLLVTGLTTTSAHADFALGMQYYEKGAFEKAYQEFIEAAKNGEYSAQFNLGAMYYRGEHVPKDLTQSYAWFALAAQDKLYKEQATHTKIFSKLSDEEKKKAETNYQNLLTEFSDEAINKALTPEFSNAVPLTKRMRVSKKAVPTYPKSMLSNGMTGWVDMIYTVDKDGTTRDHFVYYSSHKAFTKASINAVRMWRYEPMLINGNPVAVNGIKARLKFDFEALEYDKEVIDKLVLEKQQKATTGDAKDKFDFAYYLEALPSFISTYTPSENPNKWYMDAANAGSSAASFFLGQNILYGNMCSADTVKSQGWLIKAATQNSPDAQYMLALELFSGARLEKNYEKGLYWLQRAAATKEAAQLRYSWIMATHPEQEKRNGTLAKTYFEKVTDEFIDKQTYYQTAAAVAAENGNFKAAIKWQKEALEDAEEFELPMEEVNAQMAAYKNKQPWREEL